MKKSLKNILACLLTMLAVLPLQSQEWKIGPSIGLNMTPVALTDSTEALMKQGISFGMEAGPVWENKAWQLTFGLTFNRRHTSYSYSRESQGLGVLDGLLGGILQGIDLSGTENIQSRTSYWTADLPVTLKYLSKSGLFIQAGLYANVLINARNKTETTTHIPLFELFDLQDLGLGGFITSFLPENGTESTSDQSTAGLTGFGGGMMGGIGADLDHFRLTVNYQYGFNDIRSDGITTGVRNQQCLSIHLAYLFQASFYKSGLKPKYDLELIK